MADPAHVATDEMIAEIEKKLKKEYSKAAREIQEKLEKHLEAFRKKVEGRLEALHNGEITKQEYENWFRGQVATGQRWKDLQGQIADDLLNVNAIARSTAEGYKPDVYALNINYATYDVEHAGLLDTSFTLYDHQTVERIMREEPALLPPPGKLVKQEIAEGKAKRWNLQIFNSVMTQGIIQGESIDKIARRISSELSTRNYAASVRYARTAMTSAQNAGRYDGYRRARDMGVHLKIEWSATLDQRTRHDHRMLHGQRREIDEPFEVSGYKILYPAQAGPGTSDIPQETIWNCRCTLIAWVKGFEGDTVKSSPKMGDLTFEEWQQANPMTKQEQDEWIRAGKPSVKDRIPVKEQTSKITYTVKDLPEKPVRPKRGLFKSDEQYQNAREAYKRKKIEYDEKFNSEIDKAYSIERFKNKQEVLDWGKSSGIVIEESIFESVDIKTLNEASFEIDRLFSKFPQIKSYEIENFDGGIFNREFRIGFSDLDDGLMEARGGIRFGKYFKDYRIGLTDYMEGVASGHFVMGDGTFSTGIRHEFGHNVETYIRFNIDKKYHMNVDDWRLNYSSFSEYEDAKKKYLTENERYKKELLSLVGLKGSSEYSNTNSNELFAEGFAAYTSGEKTEFAKQFGDFLKRWL